jgi:hypothetical protein
VNIGDKNIRHGWPLWFGTSDEKGFQRDSLQKMLLRHKERPFKRAQ